MEEDLDNIWYTPLLSTNPFVFFFVFAPSNNNNKNKNKNRIQGKTFLLIALLGD